MIAVVKQTHVEALVHESLDDGLQVSRITMQAHDSVPVCRSDLSKPCT